MKSTIFSGERTTIPALDALDGAMCRHGGKCNGQASPLEAPEKKNTEPLDLWWIFNGFLLDFSRFFQFSNVFPHVSVGESGLRSYTILWTLKIAVCSARTEIFRRWPLVLSMSSANGWIVQSSLTCWAALFEGWLLCDPAFAPTPFAAASSKPIYNIEPRWPNPAVSTLKFPSISFKFQHIPAWWFQTLFEILKYSTRTFRKNRAIPFSHIYPIHLLLVYIA